MKWWLLLPFTLDAGGSEGLLGDKLGDAQEGRGS